MIKTIVLILAMLALPVTLLGQTTLNFPRGHTPTAAFAARGVIEGTVRTTTNVGVFGAIVVAVGQNGQPMATTVTDPEGNYSIAGLPAGSYTLLAEPMDGPFAENNFLITLSSLYPSKTVNINFTTRFR